jgi:hypothetical protein
VSEKWDRCLFCNTKTKMTREHLWGKIIPKYLPRNETPDSPYIHILSKVENGNRKEKVASFSGKQAMFSQTYFVVCSHCNNGWMSKVETDFGNFFKKTQLPWYQSGAFEVSPYEKKSIYKWAMMKSLIEATSHIAVHEGTNSRKVHQAALNRLGMQLRETGVVNSSSVSLTKCQPNDSFAPLDMNSVCAIFGPSLSVTGLENFPLSRIEEVVIHLQTVWLVRNFALQVSINANPPNRLVKLDYGVANVDWHLLDRSDTGISINGNHHFHSTVEKSGMTGVLDAKMDIKMKISHKERERRRQLLEKHIVNRRFKSKHYQ